MSYVFSLNCPVKKQSDDLKIAIACKKANDELKGLTAHRKKYFKRHKERREKK